MIHPQIPNQSNARLVSLRRVSGAGLANVSYLVIQSLLFVVMTPLVLKALGPEVYGLWIIMAAITGFANLASFGMGGGVTKYVSEFSVADDAGDRISAVISFSFLFILLSGILTGLVLFFFSHWIAVKMTHNTGEAFQLARALTIISCGITLTFLIQIPKGVLFALVYHKVVGAIDVAQSVFILVAALIIGLKGGDIVALAVSLITINLTILVILIIIALQVTRSFSLHFTLDLGLARQILRYSLFAWLSGIGTLLFTQADRILVGIMLGPAAAGAYAICTGVAARLNSLASSATQVLVPFASSYQAHGKNAEIAKVFLNLLRIIGCLVAVLGIVLIFWSKWILSIWISPEFSLTYNGVFGILILAYALFSMATPGYYIAFGLGRPEVPAILNVGGALLMLIFIGILSPRWGLFGAGVANLAYTAAILVNFYVARQLCPTTFSPVFKAIGPPILVLLFSLILCQYGKIELLSIIIINLTTFASLIWLAMNEGRVNYILKLVKLK